MNDTPLHTAIRRAFPQSKEWQDNAIKLLGRFDDGEVIAAHEVSGIERSILHDLATAGLIVSHRYPIFSRGIFSGLWYFYEFSNQLQYTPPFEVHHAIK